MFVIRALRLSICPTKSSRMRQWSLASPTYLNCLLWFFHFLVEWSWPDSYSGFYTLHLVLELDHYRTIINIVQVSGSYPVLIDPSYPLHILWSWHISCPDCNMFDFCNRICQTMEEDTHWTFISNTDTGCGSCCCWSTWGELLVLCACRAFSCLCTNLCVWFIEFLKGVSSLSVLSHT